MGGKKVGLRKSEVDHGARHGVFMALDSFFFFFFTVYEKKEKISVFFYLFWFSCFWYSRQLHLRVRGIDYSKNSSIYLNSNIYVN